jgi:hypothetical protein
MRLALCKTGRSRSTATQPLPPKRHCRGRSGVGLNDNQTVITFAYHRVRKILLHLRPYYSSDLSCRGVFCRRSMPGLTVPSAILASVLGSGADLCRGTVSQRLGTNRACSMGAGNTRLERAAAYTEAFRVSAVNGLFCLTSSPSCLGW